MAVLGAVWFAVAWVKEEIQFWRDERDFDRTMRREYGPNYRTPYRK